MVSLYLISVSEDEKTKCISNPCWNQYAMTVMPLFNNAGVTNCVPLLDCVSLIVSEFGLINCYNL